MKVRTTFLLFSLVAIPLKAWSALQTMPFIAPYGTPKYSQLDHLPYANVQAPKGGELTRAVIGNFDNLNSMNGRGTAVEGTNYLFDSLMSSSLDEPAVMYPLLAEKVSYDPKNFNAIIFHLNPKARFSDGSPVTAADVKFSFDIFQTKSNFGLQMYLSDLAKTEVLSKYSVKMHFKTRNNVEMPLIVARMPIYSKKDWQGKDFSQTSIKPILGSGPYLLEKINAGQRVVYKRNPKYWARDLKVNQGRYNFNRVGYVYYRSKDIAFTAFKAGLYTLHEEESARQWVTAYNFPAVKQGLVKKYRFKHFNPIPTQSFVFNTRRQPFQDIYFRQALTYAYDFEWQNKAMFYGQYQRLQSYFSNSELEAKGLPSAAEIKILKPYLAKLHPVQRDGVLKNWRYSASDGSGYNRNNLLIARQILLKNGYTYNAKGQLLDRKNKPIQFEFLIQPSDAVREITPFVRHLKRLGIQLNIRQVDTPQYYERMRTQDFDMTLQTMPQSLTPGKEQVQLWGSASAHQVGNYNYSGIQNPVIDQMIRQLIQAHDRKQVVVQTRILDRLLRAGYYQIPTYGKADQWYAYWNMYQKPARSPQLHVGLDYWWSDAKQAKQVSQYLGQAAKP